MEERMEVPERAIDTEFVLLLVFLVGARNSTVCPRSLLQVPVTGVSSDTRAKAKKCVVETRWPKFGAGKNKVRKQAQRANARGEHGRGVWRESTTQRQQGSSGTHNQTRQHTEQDEVRSVFKIVQLEHSIANAERTNSSW